MMKLFPELRRPWSDGLVSALGIQDYRDPFEIQFGLFGDDDGGGGSDSVDRSNPNEMAAREKAAARAGTVTDSSGNPVTSGGGTSVVTSGSQGQQVAAREAFNAATGNTRSNYAQDQYDQVAARETAALNRAAEAGRLASAPASSALANVGDVTQAQYGPFASDQPQLNFVAPQISRPEVNLSATSRPDIPANAQNMSNQILSRRVGSPAAIGIDTNIAMTALQDRALQGDVEAQDMLNQAATRGDITRDQADYAFGFTQQAPASAVGQTVAEAATAANVLQGTSPADMARIATADAGMITDQPQFLTDLELMNMPTSEVERLASNILGSTFNAPRGTSQANQMGTMPSLASRPSAATSINDPQLGNITQTTSPDGTVNRTADLGNFRSSTNITRDTAPASIAAGPVLSGATGPASDIQNLINQAAANPRQGYTPNVVNSPELMGQQAAAGTPAENFYTDAYRGVYPDVEGNIPGTTMAGIGNAVRSFPGLGMLLSGGPQDLPSATEQAAFKSGELLSMGGTMDEQTGAISDVPAGRGTLGMNRFGMVTYSGMPDPNYTGPYRELVNPPPEDMGGSDELKTASDPCPEGYQMVDGVCQPVDDVTADDPAAPGSNFVINPTTGLPTLFQPTTQATQVGPINPFVLQPYPRPPVGINPPGSAAASGIQALSPTGAALGRQV